MCKALFWHSRTIMSVPRSATFLVLILPLAAQAFAPVPDWFSQSYGGLENDAYDYIVVGAGATGCPFARTVADAGKRVLLIERGPERSYKATPNAMDISGTGLIIQDSALSQPVLTTQGIRSHIASVMGGGTSINMGISVEESSSYFEYLNSRYDDEWDIDMVNDVTDWIREKVANPMPQDGTLARAWSSSLQSQGFHTIGRDKGKPAYSTNIHDDGIWGGYSLFDSKDGFFRNAADVLLGDGYRGGSRPSNLTVLANHIVTKVIFSQSDMEDPRATCVEYRRSVRHDADAIGYTTAPAGLTTLLRTSYSLLQTVNKLTRIRRRVDTPQMKYSCVKEDGVIVLAAGAVHTPLLLFRSGVGPRWQIDEIGLPLVKSVPRLGQNFGDRPFLSIPLFFREGHTSSVARQSRICPALGLQGFGPDCSDYEIGQRTATCSMLPIEMLSGPSTNFGTLLATRLLLPISWRDNPIVDMAFEVISWCSKWNALDKSEYPVVCRQLEPWIGCARRSFAPFYMLAEPKSRGSVTLDRYGRAKIDPNYFGDSQDVFDAVRGVQKLLQIVNSEEMKRSELFQKMDSTSCPITVLNGLLDLVAVISVSIEDEKNLASLRNVRIFINELKPDLTQSFPDLEKHKITEDNDVDAIIRVLALKQRTLENTVFSTGSEMDIEDLYSNISNYKLFLEAFEASDPHDECPYTDLLFYANEVCKSSDTIVQKLVSNVKDGKWALENNQSDIKVAEWIPYTRPIGSRQWAAAYPPVLPRPEDPIGVASHVTTFAASIWHHFGSAEMGQVVNSDFRVKGISNLSIIDASVLHEMTRMNPTATLLMMGRYAALRHLSQ